MAAACSGPEESTGPFAEQGGDRAVFINYWAEWCKPCREEIPELNQFREEFAGQVDLYGVNFDGATGERLAEQEKALGVEFPTIPDPGPARGWVQPEGLPYTIVADKQGNIIDRLPGIQSLDSLRRALEKFQREQRASP